MTLGGYAFMNESQLQKDYWTRYNEIKQEANKIDIEMIRRTPGSNIYDGKVLEGGEFLSELDIALILDKGNLCFGGECAKYENRFRCTVYTD